MAIQATVQDNVESFYWVLLYTVLRKLAANMGVPREPHRKLIRTMFFLTTFEGTSATEILDGRATGLTTIRRHKLLGKRVAAGNISHAPRVLLWRYDRHL